MPLELNWVDEHTFQVIHIGAVTVDEINAFNGQLISELDKAGPPLFAIYDLRKITAYPTNVRQLMDSGQSIINHQNLEHVIFIGLNNPVLKFLTSVISQIGKKRFTVVNKWEDVEATLGRLRTLHV